ncbi:MAG: hypothetical protein AMJ89_00635 [candidate division Zixibacteria bacterium SM23_73]|nr:MAG: hypothetical protein AMJ89_00635 [candidate division Zixibacteria bacterium SM23_73]
MFLKNFPEPVKTQKNPTCHAERSISLVEHLLFEILPPASGGRTDKMSVTNKRRSGRTGVHPEEVHLEGFCHLTKC